MKLAIWIRSTIERLDKQKSIKSILANSAWLVIDKLFRLTSGLLIGAWIARHFGPAEFGELAYALAFIALFQAIVGLGLDGIVVRELAKNEEPRGTILGTAFVLRTITGLFSWIAAVACMSALHGATDKSTLLVAIAGGSLIFQAADTIDLWFQSQSQSKRTVAAKLSAHAIVSLTRIVLLLSGAPIEAFAAATAIEGLLSLLALTVAYKKLPANTKWSPATSMGSKLLKESWPFLLSGISVAIYMRIDQIMIKQLLGEHQLGIYAAVLPLATTWQFLPMTLFISLAPFIAKKRTENEAEYWIALSKSFKVFALLGWIVALSVAAMSSLLVTLLYGEQYKEGAVVLSIYAFTNLFINMGLAQSLWLINEKKAILSLLKTLTGAAICIGGNYLLIPKYGLIGAATVGVLTQFCSAIAANLFFSKKILKLQVASLINPFFKP